MDGEVDVCPVLPEPALQECRIEATMAPRINIAFHQNAVPVLRELAMINDGERPVSDITLSLSCEPGFLASRTWHIDRLDAGQRFHFAKLDLPLDGALLGRLGEAEAATAVFSAEAGGITVARLELPIELLPRSHWGGVGHMPEMVAAFVEPNDPAIERLLKSAAEVLRQHGRSGALDGYAGGARRAWELASAVWSAVGGLGLDYALPPPSFEYAGQKVRGPSQVVEHGLATCLDTTLLFCAALEHCGLNPLVVVTHGHAFAGVWLVAEEFTTAVVDDVTALRKRVKLNELALFETTLATTRPCPGFALAVERGARLIGEAEEHAFELAIDLRRARMQRIRPLASTAAPASLPDAPAVAEPAPPAFAEPPADLPDAPAAEIVPPGGPTPAKDRLDRWQRKLLDLSLRNALLNFRAGKRAIVLDAPDPGLLEDLLAEGRTLRLLPRPDLMAAGDPRSADIHEQRTHEDLRRGYALDALRRNEVLAGLNADELETRLTELYRSARAALQEGGANTLFLALGFLSWSRDAKDGKEGRRVRAPLLLIPVTLHRKSVHSGFTLQLHDDEPRFNPTLLQMLRQDFALSIPVAEGELPRDDSGLDVAGIWKAVRLAIKDIPGWEVAEEVVLATFSFAKYLMWKDLVDRTEALKQNPVVRHLIDTPREPFPGGAGFPNPRRLDADYGPQDTFCPLPADSSQLSAVMAGARGKSFVLVGPPGTGKSQTIANLIAQCLAEGRSVLFVSEKIAALEVVYRRLRDVGLGEFCLELHSSKARKLDVLDQLRRSWEAKGESDAAAWVREAQRLKGLRDQLNGFVEHLHRRHRNGLTAYRAIGLVVAARARRLGPVGLSWPSADAHDEAALGELRALVDRLEVLAGEVGAVADGPLRLVGHGEWSSQWQRSLIEAAGAVVAAAAAVEAAAVGVIQVLGIAGRPLQRGVRDGLAGLARTLPQAAGRDWRFVLRPDARSLSERLRGGLDLLVRRAALVAALSPALSEAAAQGLRRGLELVARHREIVPQLSLPYGDGAAVLDVPQLRRDWAAAEVSVWPLRPLRRKAVAKALATAAGGGGEPEVAADLDRLASLRDLARELDGLAPVVAEAGGLWRGLDSDLEAVRALLAFQTARAAMLTAAPWSEAGLEPVAAGRCGAAWAADHVRLLEIRALDREIDDLEDLRGIVPWAGLRTRSAEAEAALVFHHALAVAIAGLAETPEQLAAVKGPLDQLLGDGNSLLDGPVRAAGDAYGAALAGYERALSDFATLAGTSVAALEDRLGGTPAALAEACGGIAPLEGKLHSWCAWRKAGAVARLAGLGPMLEALERGAIAPTGLPAVFEADYARWWLGAMVDGDEVLRGFVSAEHDRRIADFRALDDRVTDLTRAHIRAGLCAGLPDHDAVGRGSEWGVLRHEMQKKRAHLPLRELVTRLPTALTRLAPCLLMSPLSIAQFLSADTALFDVVVFDEASQIPVWDAIGAIARGRQVVMVGDPKQLPPTAFFDRAEAGDAEDDGDAESDLESILDECLGSNLPTLGLSWHYRSRHESLIAFSNHRYYEGGLVTFPSPVTDDRAVRFHHVGDGLYEKGGARVNQPEARAVVADIVGRLTDPAFRASGLTIGVVTFNSEQQRLIEDLLDDARRNRPELEAYFAEEALEPLFVKNLENVQGDERDLMYFSITYGPDLTGAVSMNFGPMNRDGGERRLNVAITRARHELRVFSSLRPEQFDLSRTAALGVRDLKHFLEFAERGARALAEAVRGSVGGHESPFESAVAGALLARGWQVHPQVGASSFRIDLGVVDPDAPGRYLAGLECDGATYHRSATARDRDKLREQVLRGLGWEIVRLWSTDWWHDAEGALDKVEARLTELLAARRAERARRDEEEARARREAEAQRLQDEAAAAEDAEVPTAEAPVPPPALSPPRRPADDLFRGEDLMLPLAAAAPVAEAAPAVFGEADPAAVAAVVDPAAFFDAAYEPTLQAMIAHVVTIEGPVREDVLARRIARAHGWTRTGARIRDRVLSLARDRFPATSDDAGLFLWPADAAPGHCDQFRAPQGDEPRPVDEIALAELAALARAVRAKGLSGDDAVAAMARAAGLLKLRAASRDRLERACALASG
jgi:very-short-patch-repair endonuclease